MTFHLVGWAAPIVADVPDSSRCLQLQPNSPLLHASHHIFFTSCLRASPLPPRSKTKAGGPAYPTRYTIPQARPMGL